MWEAGKWNFLRPSYRSCRECCLDEFSFFLFARSCLSRSCNYIFRYHGPFPRSLMLNMGYDYPRVTGKTGSEVAHVYASVWFFFFALSLSYRIFKNEEISNHINKLILPRSKNILRSPSTLVRPKGGRVRKRQRRYVRILTNRKILFFPARIQSSKQKKSAQSGEWYGRKAAHKHTYRVGFIWNATNKLSWLLQWTETKDTRELLLVSSIAKQARPVAYTRWP